MRERLLTPGAVYLPSWCEAERGPDGWRWTERAVTAQTADDRDRERIELAALEIEVAKKIAHRRAQLAAADLAEAMAGTLLAA